MRSLVSVLLAAALLSFGRASSARAAAMPCGEDARYESILRACSTVGPEATAQALLGSSADAIDWIVRVRLGLAPTTPEWDDSAQIAAALALRSRANIARSALDRHMNEDPQAPHYEFALAILADLGAPDDLATLVRWSTALDAASTSSTPEAAARTRGADALREATGRLANLAADDSRVWRLNVERAPLEFATAIVRGLADSDHPAAVARLAELLDSSTLPRPLLMAEIARAARRSDRMHDEAARARIRPMLESSDVDLLRDAALCIGALGDDHSAPTLAHLLEHANAGVRANAAWSLARLTGRRIGAGSPNWSQWLEEESKWWRESAPAELRQLNWGDPHLRAEAARELSMHRYPRHELALEIARALPLDDVATSKVACAALLALKSANAVDVLEQRLADEADGAARDIVAEVAASLAATRSRTRAEMAKL